MENIDGTLHWESQGVQRETPVRVSLGRDDEQHRIGIGTEFYALEGNGDELRRMFGVSLPEAADA